MEKGRSIALIEYVKELKALNDRYEICDEEFIFILEKIKMEILK